MSHEIIFFEQLRKKHRKHINDFDCGEETVNEFLKVESFKLQKIGSAITRLYFSSEKGLLGYFTLFNESVTVLKNKRVQQKWQDISGQKSTFPAIRLHYLGIDRKFQKQGYGEILLFDVIKIAKRISRNSGCTFITLETLKTSYKFYEDRNFIYLRKNQYDGKLTDMCLRLNLHY